jgi:TonB family protein
MQVIVPDGVDGVGGGIVSGVPGTVTPDEQQSPMRIASIVVSGLSDQARSELLASLPVHDGDELNTDLLERTKQAVKAFDEHLAVQRAIYRNADGTMALSFLLISLPGARTAPMLSPGGSSAPAAFADTPGQRIKVGGNVQAMMIVSKAAPVYPELAKSARVSGVVRLAVLIAKNGTIQEIHSLDGPALLIQAAMDAVKQWVYKPTFLNGEPVAVESTIDVNFTLNQ